MKERRRGLILAMASLLALGGAGVDAQEQMSAAEHVAAFKATMAVAEEALKRYEWIETTTVSFRGEEKSRRQNKCYFGAEGKVQKVAVSEPPPQPTKRGVRGRVAERKKEELTDAMKEAVALVHRYVPPDPARIEAARAAGRVTIQPLGQRVKLVFADFLKPGDSLAADVDLATHRLLGVQIASYLDSPADAVALDVAMGALPGNVSYAATCRLDVPGRSLSVTVENGGYRQTR